MARRAAGAGPFEEPASKAVRKRGERLMRKVEHAVARLDHADDQNALHDVRVALRRLRGWLRAFPKVLPLKRRRKRALRRLAHMTNPARDAEVCIGWLPGLTARSRDGTAAGYARLDAEFRAMREREYRHLRKNLPAKWRKQSKKLKRGAG